MKSAVLWMIEWELKISKSDMHVWIGELAWTILG